MTRAAGIVTLVAVTLWIAWRPEIVAELLRDLFPREHWDRRRQHGRVRDALAHITDHATPADPKGKP